MSRPIQLDSDEVVCGAIYMDYDEDIVQDMKAPEKLEDVDSSFYFEFLNSDLPSPLDFNSKVQALNLFADGFSH